MGAKLKLDLTGFEAYLEKLARFGADVDEAAAAALTAAADVVLAEMQALVPVDTGDLKSHLNHSEANRSGNEHWMHVGLYSKEGSVMRKGLALEYGSVKMPAHPYIRPALTKSRQRARAAAIAEFKKRLAG